MTQSPAKIAEAFKSLKKQYTERLVLKLIKGRYYVYKEKGLWIKDTKRNKTISEYIGKITTDGIFIKKKLSAKDDLENAKAIIAEHGGEIIWHEQKGMEIPLKEQHITTTEIDLRLLMTLSMNARMSIAKVAKITGIDEQTAYSRIKALEKKLGIKYLLEVDIEKLGYTTYLILVKFDTEVPSLTELQAVFSKEFKVQFAALTKGNYDVLAYILDENSVKAEDSLWKIMSETSLSKYHSKWYLIPFGQVYSFVPLRDEFVDNIIKEKEWKRTRSNISPKQEELRHREFSVLKELIKNSITDFVDIDARYALSKGAARYTYQELKSNGIIVRPTITMQNMPFRYLGIVLLETVSPIEVKETRHKLLLDELEYGQIANKYILMGNISIPEGAALFVPILDTGEMDQIVMKLKNELKGMVISSIIITDIIVGSLCYRRFDNTYSKQYLSLARMGMIEEAKATEYD